MENELEIMLGYEGEGGLRPYLLDIDLFRSLNEEYRSKPVVPAPRPHTREYGREIGLRRGAMLEKRIGLSGMRILELGCGAGDLAITLKSAYECDIAGVDVSEYQAWADAPSDVDLRRHDVTADDNSLLGTFDRVISFAVLEHVTRPHTALEAVFQMLKPGGKAYIYANLYRGAKASHRYREVFFPWPHLLFDTPVWHQFYEEEYGAPLEPAWVNRYTYDQYVATCTRLGFTVTDHLTSPPYFDEAFYHRFEYDLGRYPQFDLRHDFIHLVLERPE